MIGINNIQALVLFIPLLYNARGFVLGSYSLSCLLRRWGEESPNTLPINIGEQGSG